MRDVTGLWHRKLVLKSEIPLTTKILSGWCLGCIWIYIYLICSLYFPISCALCLWMATPSAFLSKFILGFHCNTSCCQGVPKQAVFIFMGKCEYLATRVGWTHYMPIYHPAVTQCYGALIASQNLHQLTAWDFILFLLFFFLCFLSS